MKHCSECKRLGEGPKPFSEFSKSKKASDGLQNWCRACHKKRHAANSVESAARNKAWRLANPERTLEHHKKSRAKLSLADRAARHLKTTFKLSAQRYEQMFEEQNGRCAICVSVIISQFSAEKAGNRMRVGHVDHCHETGSIRGLLCHACNTGLGKFRDDETVLLSAARYLRENATAKSNSRMQHDTLQSQTEPHSRDLGSSTSRGNRREEIQSKPALN